jgi:7-carboxy-7-deazaguanine synthase
MSPAPRRVDAVLRLPAAERLKVHEIFYSLQGESTFAGRPCVLVRLTGCQMRCRWCDSEYAFYDGEWMSVDAVLERVAEHGCPLVELTGGEPLLQPAAKPLLARLCDRGYEVLLETGGGLDVAGVDPRVRRIVDVKCPGSGEAEHNFWPNLDLLTPRDEVKMVLANEADYVWARDLVRTRRLAETCPVHFSPVHGAIDSEQLASWILRDRLPVRLQLQLHKLLWGAAARGV